MSDIREARRALVTRILGGEGKASHAQRRAAFDDAVVEGPARTLVQRVARHAYRVTDEDIAAVRASGTSEDEIFEIVVCSAIGQATRQHDAALAALEAASSGKE
jgi:alkylhydroperoxidase family enzyme